MGGNVVLPSCEPLRLTNTKKQCCGSGIRCFFDPWTRIRDRFFPDPGSRILNPYFLELGDKFLGQKFYNSLKTGPNFFLKHFKNKIIFNFVKFVATKKVWQQSISPLSFVEVFGCGIRDPESRMDKQSGSGIRIRNTAAKNIYFHELWIHFSQTWFLRSVKHILLWYLWNKSYNRR